MGLVNEKISDKEFVDALMSLQRGLDLLFAGYHPNAFQPLRNSLHIIKRSSDAEAGFFVSLMADFCEGISKLLSGDAHGAYELLDISAESMERVSFFYPNFDKAALSMKAASYVALARTYLNTGDLDKVESLVGNVNQIHSSLLSRLDDGRKEDILFLSEVFAIKVEMAMLFSYLDLGVLDFDAIERRLKSVEPYFAKLESLISKAPEGPIRYVMELDCILYSVLKEISLIGKKVIVERSHLEQEGIKELRTIDDKLFKVRQIAHDAGDRGRGYFYTINQLSRLQERLLVLGKVTKRDFGQFSGIISLFAFLVLLITVQLTIRPSGIQSLPYFLGELIVALIVGFGYGALKFKPLLTLFADAISSKKDRAEKISESPKETQ